jgi:hypothetical protein
VQVYPAHGFDGTVLEVETDTQIFDLEEAHKIPPFVFAPVGAGSFICQ